MYVCLCKAVTEGQIRDAVCAGARRMRELNQKLGVAQQCGKCCQQACHLMREQLTHLSETPKN